jgi:hypothetical protein
MSSKNDTGEIIKEFLELWQKQFSYATKEPDVISNMLKMFQQAQEQYLNAMKKGYNAEPNATTDIPADADAELRQLRLSVASLEKRVAQLESGVRIARQKTARKNTARKSGRTDEGVAKPTKH